MENQSNLSLFLHNSSSVYYLNADLKGRYIYVNELFSKIFLHSINEITHHFFADSIDPDDLPDFNKAWKECIDHPGKTVCCDLRITRDDKSRFWARWELCALISEGVVKGIQAIGNDISERKRAELERQAVQENMQLLLNNTEEAFIMIGSDLGVVTFNRVADEKMLEFFGTRLKKGLCILQFAEPQRVEALKILYAQVLTGQEHESETRVNYMGRSLVYTNHFKPAYDAENKIAGAIITSRDVSLHKFAEEKLARERYLLRILIDHLPDYIYVKDTNFRHIINNRANLDLIGAKTEEETIGKTVLDYFDEKSAREQISADQVILESGNAVNNLEESLINSKGEKKWLLTTKVPLKEADDRVIGLVGISRDITERKKIEESLRISIERFDIVSKATNDAIWDWDLLTNNVLWNEAVKGLFGVSHEDIAQDGEWWANHIHPDEKERVLTKIHAHIDHGIESWQDEYRFACNDGSYKEIFDRGFILFDDNQRPYRMIGAMTDISERRVLEDELAAQRIARQRQITEAAIMAQEKERAEIGRELHDNINQILTTTKLYIDMAINEKDIREELMLKSHANISSAIEEIRILSKSLVPPSLGDIGIREAILEMVKNLNLSQKIKIKFRTSGSKIEIPGNIKLMVFRIIQEQLNNIIKHSKASEAEIKLAVSKENLNITVTDNGIGFDPRKKTKGIGLTNIISRAEVHNGQVEINSSVGNGCVLKISIPI